jgi:hypothetical protein
LLIELRRARVIRRADAPPARTVYVPDPRRLQILTRNGQPADETGLKDTVLLDSFDNVTLLTYFENPGMWTYPLHCRIECRAQAIRATRLRGPHQRPGSLLRGGCRPFAGRSRLSSR